MPHALKLKVGDTIQALREAIKKSDDEFQKTRLRAIICIKEGTTHTDTAKRFVVSRTSIIAWICAYNAGGIASLKMSQGGRPKGKVKWDGSIFEGLVKEIDQGKKYWSIPLMQAWIKEQYDQHIPEQTIWYRLDHLNYSYKSARPHPLKGNAEKQEAFKKGAPSNSR